MATRTLSLVFEVTDHSVTDEALHDLAEEIVKWINVDPPILTYDGATIARWKD